ncbi:MAG: hypothetical protein K6F78_09730 [Bacteroidaceae bacterium]|nr:hypothetical protein [Bacteroidaceae bacterium]
MGIISKLTNPLNHGKDLEEARKAYEKKVQDYMKKQEELSDRTISLYELRKDSLRKLQALDSYVMTLENCPESIRKGTKRSLEYADAIREAWDFENAPHTVNGETGNSADASMMGAAFAGGAFAMGGPAAAMAIATTFGTTSTGAAISSLGGAAAANAALAWLGGGAIVAGGAGMSGGAALLGLFGTIGWSIAGVAGIAFIVKSTFTKKKNDQAIEEIRKYSRACDSMFVKICNTINQVKEIERHTKIAFEKVGLDKLGIAPTDYNTDNYPQSLLFEKVSEAKILGKLMRQSVTVK